jgi:DNA polymerase-3 subunit alpha
MAASLTSEMSNSDRVMILLAECRRMNLRVRPPDVNLSEEAFTVRDGAIRFGLGAVKGVGHNAVESIRVARSSGPYRDLFDFCEKIDPGAVNRKCIEALIHAGAMDDFGRTRASLLEGLPTAMEWAARRRREKEVGQGSLFGGPVGGEEHPGLPSAREWEVEELLRREKGALGFFVSGHPLDSWREVLERFGAASTSDLDSLEDGGDVVLGGIPVQHKNSTDRRGNPMAFVTMEDFTGTVECICFGEAYLSCREYLTGDRPILFRGRLSTREQEKPKILLEEAFALADLVKSGRFSVHLAVGTSIDEERLLAIAQRLDRHPGSCAVYLHVDHLMLGGVQMRLRERRVCPDAELLEALETLLGRSSVRLLLGEPQGKRSAEIFARTR